MADDGMSLLPAWITPDVLERRKALASHYADCGGIEAMHEMGLAKVEPQGDRVLLRAILTMDASALGQHMSYDARQAIAHEVVAVGPGARKWWWRLPRFVKRAMGLSHVEPGMHAFVVSSAADRLSKQDTTVRLWTTRADHVAAAWWPPRRAG